MKGRTGGMVELGVKKGNGEKLWGQEKRNSYTPGEEEIRHTHRNGRGGGFRLIWRT
jgi:hypothetical protein